MTTDAGAEGERKTPQQHFTAIWVESKPFMLTTEPPWGPTKTAKGQGNQIFISVSAALKNLRLKGKQLMSLLK